MNIYNLKPHQLKKEIHFNNNIKINRIILNLTQQQLANIIGTSKQTISNIENNKANPNILIILKLSKLFNKPIDQLFSIYI